MEIESGYYTFRMSYLDEQTSEFIVGYYPKYLKDLADAQDCANDLRGQVREAALGPITVTYNRDKEQRNLYDYEY